MSKAIISNRIYLDPKPELRQQLIKDLTYKIKKPPRPGLTHFSMYEVIKAYKILPKGVISIPSGRIDLIPEDFEIVDKRVSIPVSLPEPKFPLRDGQIALVAEADGTCFINAKVGWGKTFTALHLARKLGQKTLIVCHNTMLRDQWILEIEALYPSIFVGMIGSGEFDIDAPIVVGNIQTLTKIIPKIAKEFGTVIVDECHHVPATTFGTFVDGMYAKNKIGLSGTMLRKDGKHILFKDFFGSKVFQPAAENTMVPEVKIVKTGIVLGEGEAWVTKVNNLLYDPEYQAFIATVAKLQIEKGHKVLIVADRVEFLQQVGELIGETCVCITGGTDFEERSKLVKQVESGEKSAIAGSRQIFSEGISVNVLSCVILAAPIANEILLEQLIGRIMRQSEGKLQPLVIDMNFSGPSDRVQNKARLGFYLRQGWVIS